jgi:LPS sulfotransferase NodH
MPDASQIHRRPGMPFDLGGKVRTAYFVCTTHRSGSTFFCEGLGDAGCGWPNEYFETSLAPIWRDNWRLPPQTDAATYLRELIQRQTTSSGMFGAKLMWHQTKHLKKMLQPLVAPEFPKMRLHDLLTRVFGDVRYLWLRREDKIAQAISLARARQTGRWHSVDITGWVGVKPGGETESFDFAEIQSIVKSLTEWEAKWERFFAQCGLRPMTLVYEEFSGRFQETMREALTFLGAPEQTHSAVPPPRHRKLADNVSKEWAQRYRAMEEQLRQQT